MTLVRSSVIRASMSGTDGSSTTWMTPSGAPARDRGGGQRPGGVGAAFPGQRVRAEHDHVPGHQREQALKNTVATGLVDGVSARTTPAGRGISTIFASGSSRGVT